MKKLICLLYLFSGTFFSTYSLFAQLPPNQPEQDCINAIPLCTDYFFQPNSYRGEGNNPDEINGNFSCMETGEENSVWYTFRVEVSGDLCFTISPVDSVDDYDWALFNITGASCAQIETNSGLEVACNWTFNQGCAGETGANGRLDCPDQFEPCIPVTAGEVYVLNVSNFTASNAGYALDFSQSTAALYDQLPPVIDEVSSFCTGITVTFDEQIACASLDPSDFQLEGPGGPFTISQISSNNCDNGGTFSRTFNLFLSPLPQQADTFTLYLSGSVADLCGNVSVPDTHRIFMPLPPSVSIQAPAEQCELGNEFAFPYTTTVPLTSFNWTFGDGASTTLDSVAHSYETFGIFPVILIATDTNGCRDTAATMATVLARPDAAFIVNPELCQDEALSIFNISGSRGGSDIIDQVWQLGDGTNSGASTPVHSYDRAGPYPITLTVTNTLGCIDSVRQFVQVYPKPDVFFLPDQDICLGFPATLTSLSTILQLPSQDSIVSWAWDMGDGAFYENEDPITHLYTSPGEWPVTLRVTSDKGCVDSLVEIQPIYSPAPPTLTNDTVCLGEPAQLVSVPEVGATQQWFTSETATDPFFEGNIFLTEPLTEPITYYIEVTSAQGCVGSRYGLSGLPSPGSNGNILAAPAILSFPDPTVTLLLAGDILGETYRWDLGDGTQDSAREVSHTYASPGIYRVSLEVEDRFGCEYAFMLEIEVEALPEVYVPNAFSPNDDGENDEWYFSAPLVSPLEISIFDRNGGVVIQSDEPDFRWNGLNTKGRPMPTGVYVWTLRGTNSAGQTVSESGTLTLVR